MQRNKLIYALAEAALVVNSDYKKGGTWTGAVEQLDKLKFVPIHVRSDGESGKGLDGLQDRGAIPWPNPKSPESLEACLTVRFGRGSASPERGTPTSRERDESAPSATEPSDDLAEVAAPSAPASAPVEIPSETLFATVRTLMERMEGARTEASVAECLNVSRTQAGVWLKRFIEEEIRDLFKQTDEIGTEAEVAEALGVVGTQVRSSLKHLVDDGTLEKLPRPVRYRRVGSIGPLFEQTV